MAALSLTAWWPVRAPLVALSVFALVAAGRLLHGRLGRAGWATAALALVLVNVVAGVNAHYGYYETVNALLGDDGLSSLPALKSTSVPAHGVLVSIPIPGATSRFAARPALVWVPPAWFREPQPQLPVVLLLHGEPGGPDNWTIGGQAPQTADAWAKGHGGAAPILVMPDVNGGLLGDTECVDSSRGRAETYLTADVPRFVQQRFGTLKPGRRWILAGLSEGGSCSLMLALRHPDLFATFGDFGGLAGPRNGEGNEVGDTVATLFGGSQQAFAAHEPADLLVARRYPQLGGWFQVGTADSGPYDATRTLAPLARTAGIDTCLVLMPGGQHTFDVWKAAFTDALPWFAARVGLLPEQPEMRAKCGTG